jgi:cyclophilin family peptidyl-prolyl cis-trans isomerase
MAKKRDLIRRRREVAKARKGIEAPHTKPGKPSLAKKEEKKAEMKDLWIAVGIVGAIILVLAALYYFTVVRPPTGPKEPSVTVMTATPVAPAAAATAAPTPKEEKKVLSWSEPPQMSIDPTKSYEALLKTDKGNVRLQLYAGKVPKTVNNFVFLARQGFYNGVTFHRVIPGFMAQTGDPTGTGSGGPGYKFADEFDASLRHDGEGIVSMANAGKNTNGSQFFITYAATPHLNDAHSVFAKVIEGMDVVKAITVRDPAKNGPPGDKIISVEIIEK